MRYNDSCITQKTSKRNGDTICSVSQALVDSENAYNLALLDGALLAAENLVPGLLPSASPSLMSAVSTNSNACWSMVQQSSFVSFEPDVSISDYHEFSRTSGVGNFDILNSFDVELLNPSDTTAPAYDSSLSFPANEAAANGVGNWHLSQPYTFNSPLAATDPTPYASDVLLRPYQCSSCPNRPAFSSKKDLKRHLLARAHWNDSTQFYRCCCGARSPRKDNHKTHMRNCGGLAPGSNSYACKCGLEQCSRDKHIEHIEDCSDATAVTGSPLPLIM
ncbi:hypothetical protein EV127DRAFT_472549 [Xylaria flabelliformis]|nr:hypothetical protein EV127DRAFT_472549 [Xylaria flabelliformis]